MRISFPPQWVTAISAVICAFTTILLLLTVWMYLPFDKNEPPNPLVDHAAALTIFNETLAELKRAEASGDQKWIAEMQRRIANANKITRKTRLAFEESLKK